MSGKQQQKVPTLQFTESGHLLSDVKKKGFHDYSYNNDKEII